MRLSAGPERRRARCEQPALFEQVPWMRVVLVLKGCGLGLAWLTADQVVQTPMIAAIVGTLDKREMFQSIIRTYLKIADCCRSDINVE